MTGGECPCLSSLSWSRSSRWSSGGSSEDRRRRGRSRNRVVLSWYFQLQICLVFFLSPILALAGLHWLQHHLWCCCGLLCWWSSSCRSCRSLCHRVKPLHTYSLTCVSSVLLMLLPSQDSSLLLSDQGSLLISDLIVGHVLNIHIMT